MGQGLVDALPPKYFGPIVTEISYFEVNAKISEFHFFQNASIFLGFSMDFHWFFYDFWKKVKILDFCIDFKIRYLSDYWSKILRRKCVGKPLTHTLWKQKNLRSFLISWGFLVQLRKDQKISSSFLNPSSNAAEIKGEWGRMRNFQKIKKFDSWRFERTSSEVFWTNSRWEIPILMSVHGGPPTAPLYL